MARAPVYVKTSSGQYTEAGTLIWGDVGLQATEFADSFRPHRNPLAGDPSYNAIQSDYISKTDTAAQTISSNAQFSLLTTNGLRGFVFDPSVDSMQINGITSTSPGINIIIRVVDDVSNIFDMLSMNRLSLLGFIGAIPNIGMTTVLQADDPLV